MPISINNQAVVNMNKDTLVYVDIYLDSSKYNRIITAASISWPKSSPF